jgi:RNA polymerase sigma factor (TIGR02999 family)
MPHSPDPSITELLHAVQHGHDGALDRLAAAIYGELHVLAAGYLRHERPDHTLQPTALVHEAFLRLVDQSRTDWKNRSHFFGIAAQMMRRILVDHARRSLAAKRDGEAITLDETLLESGSSSQEVLQVNDAVEALAAVDERQARIVELRYFVGFTLEETAEILGISPATVSREWTLARAWLYDELSRQ